MIIIVSNNVNNSIEYFKSLGHIGDSSEILK